ncbi:hemagglutinin repeat-containing protein [Agrobacterium pusense]|uniref:hemagglutinin repeat-containing protein n=1 Tax=Agrobacterium pusense TaxID=648995 RepID=UPI00241543DC|nr:hemagglutinin repeat-containing protein [Agrobacterium pusense]WFN89107.1 hemagglutinin repeat-containing protein [Agrobacterium pusense]
MTSQFKRLPRKTIDLALFAGAGTLAQKIIATVVSFTLLLQPALLHAQDISPEVGGSFANRPGIGAAPNGVPLIDIVGPNSQGLSHNKYNNFNVGTPGVILNNFNGEVGTSKLGGVTPGNPNLQGKGPASVILNEVTSQNRSSLLGPTEVFGGRADVIIANPNGITCDGCGFINTPRATLTTGVPDIGSDGRLNGFTVNAGDVTFGPGGGNFALGDGAVSLFDVVSRTIQIDGTIYGEDLRLTAGKSKFDYATGEATALDATSGTPEYAIDGSALGAMQAGRIKMVVTEKGAGVRMRGDMAANAGELSLSADGKISIGNTSGNNGVSISSKGSVSAGRLTSKKSVSVKAGKDVRVASIGAEEDILINGGAGFIDVAGTLGASGALNLLADGRIALADASAAGPVSLWSGAGSIAISGTAQSGAAMSLTAASGAITAGSLLSKGDLALLSGLDLGISGLVLAEGNLQASAGSDIRYDSLEANGDVLLSSTGGVISFDKRTAAGGDIRIRQQNADLSNNRSRLATSGTLYINANNINLTNSTLTSGGIDLTSSGTTDLTGARLNAVTASSTARSVQGSGDIAIQAGSLTANDATNILAAHDLTLSLSQLANSGQLAAGNDLALNIAGNLTNTATGLIYARNDAALFVGGVLANDQGAIVAGRDLTIAGSASGARNAATVNSSGLISASRNISILTANLRNEKSVAPTYTSQQISNALVSAYDTYYARECGDCSSPVSFAGKQFVIGAPIRHVYRDVTEDRLTSAGSPAATIKAGNTLFVDTVDLTNAYSNIEAGSGMTLVGSGTLNNLGLQLQRTTSLNCNQQGGCQYYPDVIYEWQESKTSGDTGGWEGSWQVAMPGPSPFGTRDASKDIGPGRSVESVEAIGGVPAAIRSGGALGITGFGTVNNTAAAGTIADHVSVVAPAPSSDPTGLLAGMTASGALFTIGSVAGPQSGGFGGTIPGQTFLYETRAAFLDVSKFYGSSYFLGRIGYQPDRQIQFLGDAYFENQYIEQQLKLATGSGFTGQDSIAQIKQLLDNGAAYLGAQQRPLGEPLTAEEIASLTESVVVYEWQTVNGTTVLAPVLHLAANDRERLNSAGALIAGNQVTIDTGLLATSGMVASTGDLSVSGSSIAAIGGTFTAGGNASLKGNESILLANAKVTAGGNLGLTSNGDINISVTERSTTSTLRDKRSFTTVVRTTSQGSEITAGGSVSANAGGNLNVIGSNIAADGTVGLKATGDVTIAEAIDTTTIDYTYRKKGGLFGGSKQTTSHTETQTVVGSSVSSGKGVSIISGGDTVVSASKVTAGDETDKADINVSAGGDLLIASGKNTAEFEQSSSSKGFLSKKSSTQYNYDEATVSSELSASGNIKLDAGGNAVIAGSNITAGDAISVAGDSVAIIGAEEQHALESSSKKSGLFAGSGGGFLSLWGKEQKEKSQSSTLNVGSALTAGTDVTLTARENDVNVIGSSIMAGRDIALEAARDVNITPGAESASSQEKEKRSGFGISVSSGGGGFSVGLGVQKTKDSKEQQSNTNAVSVLTAGRDLLVSAGNNVNLQAATASAGRDVDLFAGNDINLLSANDRTNYQEMHEKTFAGVTVSVSSQVGKAAESIMSSAERLSDGGVNAITNTAIAGLGFYQAYKDLQGVSSDLSAGKGLSFNVGINAGVSHQENSTSSFFSTPVVTDIRAGRSINIEAENGNITSEGAQILAGYGKDGLPFISSDALTGDIFLSAENGDINLNAAKGTSDAASSNKSWSASAGINMGCTTSGGCNASVGVNGSYGKGGSTTSATSHTNTHVNGTGDVTIVTNDLALKGATVAGNSVTADVKNLTIQSQVNTATAKADQLNASGQIGFGNTGVSGSTQKAKGDAAVVTEQSGIHAGTGGTDLNVEQHTSLVGGLITSEAGEGRNNLSTGTLDATDIDTHSSWKAETYGGSIGTGGLSIAPPVKAGESETGKAYSAIGGNIPITITDPDNQTQDIGTIRRDTANTNTSLPGLPDLEHILRRQYKTQADLQEAQKTMAGLAGDIASSLYNNATTQAERDLWDEGGAGRALLHAIGGGILGGVNGWEGALRGALGGTASALMAPAIADLVKGMLKDSSLSEKEKQTLATLIGASLSAGVGAAVGGGEGAAYGAAEYQYNYLNHNEQLAREKAKQQLAKCKAENACTDAQVAALQEQIGYWDQLDTQRDAVLADACNANRTSPACVAAITDALKAIEYLRNPADPMVDPSSIVPGGYADMEMRLVNGRFGGLSNQGLAAAVYAERLRTIELLARYPDSVQTALSGFVNQSIANAAIAVLTFGIAEKLGQTKPGSAGSNGTAGQTTEGAANTIATKIAPKIERQIGRRGWDRNSINETIAQPQRTVTTRDTRHNPETGVRNDDPATAFINRDGSYVVRNNRTGDIVQVSDRTDPSWKSPFE